MFRRACLLKGDRISELNLDPQLIIRSQDPVVLLMTGSEAPIEVLLQASFSFASTIRRQRASTKPNENLTKSIAGIESLDVNALNRIAAYTWMSKSSEVPGRRGLMTYRVLVYST